MSQIKRILILIKSFLIRNSSSKDVNNSKLKTREQSMLTVGQTVKVINNSGLRAGTTLNLGGTYKVKSVNEEGGVQLEGLGSTSFKSSRFEIVTSGTTSPTTSSPSSPLGSESVLLIDNSTNRIINTFSSLSAAQTALSNSSMNLDNIRVLQAKPLRITKTVNVSLA